MVVHYRKGGLHKGMSQPPDFRRGGRQGPLSRVCVLCIPFGESRLGRGVRCAATKVAGGHAGSIAKMALSFFALKSTHHKKS